MKDEPFNRHIESARHSLKALRSRLLTSPGAPAPGMEIAGHLGDIETALDAAALEWSQQRDALAAIQTEIAEGTRVEKARRESEEKFRVIAEYTVDWENWIGLDGKLLWVSPGVERVTGYSVAEFRAMHTSSLLLSAEEDREVVRAQFQRAMAGTCENDQEFRFVHKDGTTRWASVSWQPAFARDGTPLGHRSSIRDITKRKQAEAALRESEAKLTVLFRILPVGVSVLDAQRNIADVNPNMERILDVSREDLLKGIHKVRTYLRPDGTVMPAEEFASTLALREQRPVHNVEIGVVKEDGNVIWTNVSAVPVAFTDWKVVVVTSDITERKRAEEALKKSNRLLRDTGEMAQVGGWELDLSTKESVWTEEVCRIHGVEPGSEPKLEEALNFYAPESRPEVEAVVKKVAETGEPYDIESLFIPAGSQDKIWVRSTGRAVYSGGKIVKLTGTFQNIDQYKRAEARIRDFSRKLLSVREEEKRRISAVLHHDVGSFTVGVTAYLNAIEEDLRKGKYKETFASLKKARRMFVQSVRRLKTLAVELRPPDLDILGLPAALRQHFSLLTDETSLRIRFTDATYGRAIPPETQTVLFRVVQESLNNVVKHARARQVQVRLSAPRKTFRLSIVDDGKGFNPARAAVKPGTHLGLRAVQEMVMALGGEFIVDASPGRGTTVLVTVPKGVPKT